MRKLSVLVFLALVALPMTASSRNGVNASSVLILSKADMRAVFAMSEAQWFKKVQRAVVDGTAVAAGTPEAGLAMSTTLPTGQLIIRPHYTGEGRKPDFIRVVLVYDHPFSAVLTSQGLDRAMQAALSRLEPEYEVFGEVEKDGGNIAILFNIVERDS